MRISETASRFEGRDHGSPVSLFVTRHPPGARVPLHRHPYAETFVVLEGTATFSVDGEDLEVPGGHVVVVPARAVHGFASCGSEALRVVSVHPSDQVVQEWLEK